MQEEGEDERAAGALGERLDGVVEIDAIDRVVAEEGHVGEAVR